MKKIVILIIASLGISFAGFSQVKVDRSKKPAPGPAPVITFKDPAMYTLPNGMTILVVEDHRLPKISASLIIDAGPVKEGDKAGVTELLGQMMQEGTTTMSKAKYDEAVDQIGASVGVSASGAFASGLTRFFPEAFGLMTSALRNPSFPEASLDKLKKQTITGLKNSEKNASAVASRTLDALSYGKNSALGEFITVKSIDGINLQDIKEAYKNSITPSRSYLTFVGDITPDAAKALATKYLGDWTGRKLQLPSIADVPNPAKSEINFIDMPTAVQAQINVGNLVNNPMNNKDYFALLLANQILGGGADSKLFMNLREKRGFTYGSYSNLGSGRWQSMFNANAQVRSDKADSAVAEIVNEIIAMRDGNITADQLATAKAKYNGSFALGMEDPARSARYASNILINNLPKDFYRTYLQKINAVTLEDIKRVSRNYMNESNTRIAIVGNADKIMPKLLRLGYPIKKYDIYADPVIDVAPADRVAQTPVTTDKISAYSIVEDYLKAIGGKEALKKINSVSETMTAEIQGREIGGTMKKMMPNKSVMEMKMGEMSVYKKAFNGTNGYNSQMGSQKDMTMDDIKQEQDDAGIFPQLNYTNGDKYKLEYVGAGKVDGEPTYRLKVTLPSGKTTVQQYSSKTGLLLQEDRTTNVNGQDVDIVLNFSNYKKVGDILIPHTLKQNAGGQEITLNTTEVKINEGVTEADFK